MYNPVIYLLFLGKLNERLGHILRTISRHDSNKSDNSVDSAYLENCTETDEKELLKKMVKLEENDEKRLLKKMVQDGENDEKRLLKMIVQRRNSDVLNI